MYGIWQEPRQFWRQCLYKKILEVRACEDVTVGRQDGRVVRALDFNAVTPDSNPALATSWCCSG